MSHQHDQKNRKQQYTRTFSKTVFVGCKKIDGQQKKDIRKRTDKKGADVASVKNEHVH